MTRTGSSRRCGLALTVLLSLGPARAIHAQAGTSKVELQAEYAFLQELGDEATKLPRGWSASVAWNPQRSLGLVLDVGGNYKSEGGYGVNEHALLAGLRYSRRRVRLTPYLEALAGTVWGNVNSPGAVATARDFAVQGGVGVALRLGERVSAGAGVDFRRILSGGQSFDQVRAVAGLSFGFGGPSAERETRSPMLPPPAPSSPSAREDAPPPPGPKPRPFPRSTPPVAAAAPGPTTQPADALDLGRDLLRRGDYARASSAFQDYLQYRASSKYTIAVGLFCDPSKVVQDAQSAVEPRALMVLSVPYRGQACYRAYWGLYDTRQAAEGAIVSLPATLRAVGQAPVPVSRLLP